MLEKELWKKLPMARGTVPNLARAMEGYSQNGLLAKASSSSSLSAVSTSSQTSTAGQSSDGFDVYMAQGNPWKATQGLFAVPCCAVLCYGMLCCGVLSSMPLCCSGMDCALL